MATEWVYSRKSFRRWETPPVLPPQGSKGVSESASGGRTSETRERDLVAPLWKVPSNGRGPYQPASMQRVVPQVHAAPLALDSWDAAVAALLGLGKDAETLVVLDEFPYLAEHTPQLDSVLQRAFGPRRPEHAGHRARLVLCGSAITVMGSLLSGTAALRGRAGMDLRVSPFDHRAARSLHGIRGLRTALHT